MRVRSVYHLKEADPTSWVIPRLPTAAKAALVELQYDEYGAGDPARLHAHLFARGLAASGLRPEYGAYVDEAPLEVLEQNNAVSMFGLQRRLRGAAVGHLAAFEATSSMPSRRMAQGLERLGFPEELVGYYTEHVEADAVHEQVALRDVCVTLVREEPALEPDVWFGAWACLDLEDRTARRMLEAVGSGGVSPVERRPDVELCPGGPMLLRGDHVVLDDEGVRAPHEATGLGGLPVRQVGVEAVVRRHPQAAAAPSCALTLEDRVRPRGRRPVDLQQRAALVAADRDHIELGVRTRRARRRAGPGRAVRPGAAPTPPRPGAGR